MDFLLVIIELFSLGVTAEALRAKIERKSAISLRCGQFNPKFQVEVVAPTNHFHTDSLANERLTTFADIFHTKKLCSRLSSSKVRFQTENRPFCVMSPLWGT